jgi:DtxR family transcriptional regulator, Mn-dependent transcriptional regulator
MVTLTIENYVKAIYQILAETGQATASNGDIARKLGVAPGTVTSMLQTLDGANLVHYQTHKGASLTDSGRTLALRVLRRHRLMELFLVKTLGMTWAEVHEEAEHLEHAVSDGLIDRIDTYLGFPDRDPHGDPIPREGIVADCDGTPLRSCAAGTRFELLRVIDQSPEFLRYLSQSGLDLGVQGMVVDNQEQAGALIVESSPGRRLVLGRDAAEKLRVRLIEG